MEPTNPCQGTWRPHQQTENGEILRCDGCGDWFLIEKGRGFTLPAKLARTAEQAQAVLKRG